MRLSVIPGTVVACLVGLSPSTAPAEETIIPIEGTVPDDGLDHFFVPFDVPTGIVEIEVRHDDLSTQNILDWGLQGPDGFRGWGGGNTEPAVIGIDAASRSYMPGPIEPGTWEVIVGKAKIVEPPGQYALEVVLRDVPTLAPQPERSQYSPPPALTTGERWYAGDFHVHSLQSGDAQASFDEIAQLARMRGLDFVVITDHNVHTQLDFFNEAQQAHPDVLFVPGVEFTTYDGHANGIGATSWVDHKIGQPSVTIEGAAQAYRDQGALFSINHPALDLGDLCIGCAWEHELDVSLIDAVEIATGGLQPFGWQFSDDAIAFWDAQCEAGRHVSPIGGSDDHKAGMDLNLFQSPIGDPTTLVWAEELSVEAIVDGVRAGRTVVKLQGPDDPMVELWPTASLDGDTVRAPQTELVATVTGGAGQAIRLVRNGAPQSLIEVTSDPFEHSWMVEAPPQGQDRYRVEVFVDADRRVVSSHLWLEDDPTAGGDETGTSTGAASTGGSTSSSADTSSTGGAAGDDAGCGCRNTGLRWQWPGMLWATVLAYRRRSPRRRKKSAMRPR